MSRRQLVFLVTMLLSVAGFLVDRFVFSGPETAQAKPSRAKPAQRSVPAAELASDENAVTDPSLTYLDKLEDLHSASARDIFSMSREMKTYYKSADEVEEANARQQGPRPGSGEEFTLTHPLEATYAGPKGWLAVISGEVLRLGDQIDDFRVTRITPYHVELRHGPERALLSLPKPGALPSDAKGQKKMPPARPKS